ncbi:hypothetical protein R1flu_021938 [Riccia fluitans]|uniref:Uncharacterized protein n=1 Tax=Riccia fluitans TaxID=41844 RepID=A0ABD1ZSC3_9MARC
MVEVTSEIVNDSDSTVKSAEEYENPQEYLKALGSEDSSADDTYYTDTIRRKLGLRVDPKRWRPEWTGFMRGEKQEWWTPITVENFRLTSIRRQEAMVVACPRKKGHILLCK